jgi:hypothetical protein
MEHMSSTGTYTGVSIYDLDIFTICNVWNCEVSGMEDFRSNCLGIRGLQHT